MAATKSIEDATYLEPSAKTSKSDTEIRISLHNIAYLLSTDHDANAAARQAADRADEEFIAQAAPESNPSDFAK